MDFTVGFGPFEFTGVMFGFEVSMAFGTTEFKHFRVITDELDAMARVDRARAEVAVLNSHTFLLLLYIIFKDIKLIVNYYTNRYYYYYIYFYNNFSK